MYYSVYLSLQCQQYFNNNNNNINFYSCQAHIQNNMTENKVLNIALVINMGAVMKHLNVLM
jgi:hypothetical protein